MSVLDRFWPKDELVQKTIEIESSLFDEIEFLCKPSRETSLVFTKLEEAQFWAIKGITREKREEE